MTITMIIVIIIIIGGRRRWAEAPDRDALRIGAKDRTPEIDTSEIIVDLQWHVPMDVQWHFPTDFFERNGRCSCCRLGVTLALFYSVPRLPSCRFGQRPVSKIVLSVSGAALRPVFTSSIWGNGPSTLEI